MVFTHCLLSKQDKMIKNFHICLSVVKVKICFLFQLVKKTTKNKKSENGNKRRQDKKSQKFKINEVLVNLLSYKLNSQKTSSNTVLQYLRDLSLLRQKNKNQLWTKMNNYGQKIKNPVRNKPITKNKFLSKSRRC